MHSLLLFSFFSKNSTACPKPNEIFGPDIIGTICLRSLVVHFVTHSTIRLRCHIIHSVTCTICLVQYMLLIRFVLTVGAHCWCCFIFLCSMVSAWGMEAAGRARQQPQSQCLWFATLARSSPTHRTMQSPTCRRPRLQDLQSSRPLYPTLTAGSVHVTVVIVSGCWQQGQFMLLWLFCPDVDTRANSCYCGYCVQMLTSGLIPVTVVIVCRCWHQG